MTTTGETQYDLVVIGGGPGGYATALYGAAAGLSIAIVGVAGWREALPDPARGMTGHFVIMSFAARWTGGEVRLNDELDDALWRVPGDYGALPTTAGLDGIIQAAFRLISA